MKQVYQPKRKVAMLDDDNIVLYFIDYIPEKGSNHIADEGTWVGDKLINGNFEPSLAHERFNLKEKREDIVSQLSITTAAGNIYDVDENSQNRIARTLMCMTDDTDTVDWVMANNSTITITKVELQEAFNTAIAKLKTVWILPTEEEILLKRLGSL
tara:strand:+ start:2502 stop:2969 length:468 start_codon:yes stop_codon:yes gene_type:complete